jgi:aspartyl-tRNA(Asn)/glutamyl-tRNA(Gln) amidotransferase subunit C
MNITRETVLYVARLARLSLSDDEVGRMQRDLDAVLGYVQKLSELDTSGVQPTTHVLEIATPLRPDEVRGVLAVAEVVRNAPQHDERAMIVPKVLE